MVDIAFAPGLVRLAAVLPEFRGLELRQNPAYPALSRWFQALQQRPAFQQVPTKDLEF